MFAAFRNVPLSSLLLVVVPFSAYLVTEGVRWLAGRWSSVRYAPAAIAAGWRAGTGGSRDAGHRSERMSRNAIH